MLNHNETSSDKPFFSPYCDHPNETTKKEKNSSSGLGFILQLLIGWRQI